MNARIAAVPAFAKINLDLRVLGKRDDGYHELRTIFQTISLADSIELAFEPARRASIALHDALAIPDNLVERAARLALEVMRAAGRLEIRLTKRIPMGAGLGGGSSDAAAILLALPVLAGHEIELPTLIEIAQQLGSDVPFFLFGGRAAAIGRGTELFPLPDAPAQYGLLAAPPIHVSTAEAYRLLAESSSRAVNPSLPRPPVPRLTNPLHPNKIGSFQSHLWGQGSASAGINDFEPVVFAAHPELKRVKAKLLGAGASSALMTGSGSAVFGLFPNRAAVARALELLHRPAREPGNKRPALHKISLVSRVRYRSLWWRALEEHIDGRTWPPRSRYSR